MIEVWVWALVIGSITIGSFGPIFFKKAASKFSFNPLELIKNYYLILGCACYGIGQLLFIPALKGGPLSVLYPVVSLSYAWVAVLSVWMLKEKMNKLKWLGILLVIIGVSFIGFGN